MFASKDIYQTAPSGGYTIGKSVRFRSSATAYLNRTPASAGNRQTWTLSAWIKRGVLSSPMVFFGAGSVGNEFAFNLRGFDAFDYYDQTSSTNNAAMTTNAVYRDPSAWYHIVFAWDTTQATSTNRWKFYVNGFQITSFSATQYPTQNYQGYVNSTVAHYIGVRAASSTPFDGYLTEVNFIDGQALTPSSFGSTNALTGVWQPAKYTGTYGTNGFYLNFSSNGTSAALGTDFSGNSNTWTVNNISVTAGVTYDSMTDVPTLTSATAANYCVLNPLNKQSSATVTDGNLALATASTGYGVCVGTIGVSSGKWYWEQTYVSGSDCFTGIVKDGFNVNTATYLGNDANSWSYYNNPARAYNNGSYTAYGATYTTGDIIGVALDMDAGTLVFYKNGVSQGTAFSSLSGTFFPAASDGSNSASASYVLNFGQRPFTYTPPTGYVALNTYNLPTSTITNGAAYMAATTYTGNGSTQNVSNAVNGVSFQPDFVWAKDRTTTNFHAWYDSVRGVTKDLQSNTTTAEQTFATGLTSFNSNGFSTGSNSDTNASNDNYVAWQWKAGTTSSSNTNGSITSTVSVGATQGFSVVTYTGNATNGATVGHGLGVSPSMIIGKIRSTTGDWYVWQTAMGDNFMRLNTTAAQTASTANGVYNTGSFTSSVFALGSGSSMNTSGGTYVAYCFAAVKGFSAFGSYTGNGSADGPFVYTGFRPRFVMMKCSTTGGAGYSWFMRDSARDTYNAMPDALFADSSTNELNNANYNVDFLSNGFKLRGIDAGDNASGQTYIYMAFAENPFRNALAR